MTGLLPSEFHFLRPAWLWLLAGLPLLVLCWRRLDAARDPWPAVVDPHLLAALRPAGAASGSASRRLLALAMLALTLATLALAGPAWQRLPQPLLRTQSALIIALDLSERMRAPDLAPDRIARARYKLADLLRERGDGQTALIAYAGDAFTVAPLTEDSATLESLLGALDHDTLPVAGQRPDRAIRLAARLLADAGFPRGQLLLLTDRADQRAVDAAREALAGGLRVSVLGVGTREGAPVPQAGGGFLHDAEGQLLLPALDEASLRALAEAGGGRYATLRVDHADLDHLGVLDAAGEATPVEEARVAAQFRDEGIWLLLLLLPLAALAFRRGWLLCLPLCVVLLPPPAQAFDLASLWRRDDQRAFSALQQGDAETAQALANDPALRGAAAYRLDDFDAAAQAFAADDNASGHYNRGNALARAGRLEDALAAYDEALARDPDLDDARANRDIVAQALEQARQQSDSQQGEGEQSEQNDSSGEQTGEQSGEQGEGDPSSQQGEGQSSGEGGDESDPSQSGQPSDAEQDGEDGEAPAGQSDDHAEQAQRFSEDMEAALTGEESEQSEAGDERESGEEHNEGEGVPALSQAEIDAREQQQAIEQWLRAIPDDPGGLLRRKFLLEQRQRQRREDD